MRSPEEISRLFADILETGSPTPEMQENFRRLKDELDEREGMLRHYGEFFDGEKGWEFRGRDVRATEEYRDLQEKYSSLQGRYHDMFFNRHSTHETDNQVDLPTDSNSVDVTVNDLLVDMK